MEINKAKTRNLLLELSVKYRNGKFKRVSNLAYPYLNGLFRKLCEDFVRTHPSVGKTLMIESRKQKAVAEGGNDGV